MGISLLRQLIAVVRALFLKGKGIATQSLHKILRALALVWKLLRSQFGWKTRGNNIKPGPPREKTTTYDTTNDCKNNDSNGSETQLVTTNQLTDTTKATPNIIPLDSSISCSLHPYPYIHPNQSRTSLSNGIRAARSAHSLAVSARNSHRSSQHLEYYDRMTPSPNPSHEEYTFDVRSPDKATPGTPSPVPPLPHRAHSMSSPQLGTGAVSHEIIELARRRVASPMGSIEVLPTASIHHSTVPDINLNHVRICPVSPELFQRYDRAKFAPKDDTTFTVKSLTRSFKEHPDPPGWTPILHPEGLLYFYHAEMKAVTEADLYNKEYYQQATEDLDTLYDFIRANEVTLPNNYTLALDLNVDPEDGVILTDYYFADHDLKAIFWLDSWEASNFGSWQQGAKSISHIRHELEAQYWHHCMLYPSTFPWSPGCANELRDLIFHYIGDATTSAFSTTPYDLDELYRMLGLVNSLKKCTGSEHVLGASSLLARIMLVFARQRFYNWHGLPEARIYRDQSVYGTKQKRTLLITILSPLLFNAPDVHLLNLEKMWVDGIMHNAVWSHSIKKLNDDWQEFILYATVLLNANVAFLAIQSIDIDQEGYRSPVQMASYLSTVSSIGSVIIGLLLIRQNRTRAHGTATDVCNFLKERSHPTLGLETLAILYSLPYALLLWGMASFLAAFAWNCFENSSISTRTIMGVAWFILFALLVWTVWMGWVHSESEVDTLPTPDPEPREGTGIGIHVKQPTMHCDDPIIRHAASDTGSIRSQTTQPANGAEYRPEQGAVVPAQTGRKLSWPVISRILNLKRTSCDSEKTAV
ncbi:hypothetical protein FA15DRAFT_667838 [Coprinopsis marcescibilis]|uniref:WW domain-containing protein n=1 Tax=Coprinopsis marcescibilis TaxID=230819 RepID=A0A5C3L051_COPMA|nr:hypothetical protein FA15DRAFT_667838 [Coprinopsis marcescibilis]